MDVKRILRHLWTGSMSVNRAFPPAAMDTITKTIADSESRHHGEIRFAVEASLEAGPLFRGLDARARALEVFSTLRVWDTEGNNGVLIYLLLADRDVEIIADRGIHAKAGAENWEKICREMEAHFRAGRFPQGVAAGIAAVGRHLEKHFPRRGAEDRNELPDHPAVL